MNEYQVIVKMSMENTDIVTANSAEEAGKMAIERMRAATDMPQWINELVVDQCIELTPLDPADYQESYRLP